MVQLLGLELEQYTQGKMTYDLRRLRLHGLIKRVPGSHHRYKLTELGTKAAQFYTRIYEQALRPAFSCVHDENKPSTPRNSIDKLDRAIGDLLQEVQLAA